MKRLRCEPNRFKLDRIHNCWDKSGERCPFLEFIGISKECTLPDKRGPQNLLRNIPSSCPLIGTIGSAPTGDDQEILEWVSGAEDDTQILDWVEIEDLLESARTTPGWGGA